MQEAKFEAIIPLSCRDAFNLAADLENYPDVLPAIKTSEVLEKTANTAKVRFQFNKDNAFASMARKFLLQDVDQISNIRWIADREITADSVSGPLKTMQMRCRLTPLADQRTRVNLDIRFEVGRGGWMADTAALVLMKSMAPSFIKSMEAELPAALKRRQQKLGLI